MKFATSIATYEGYHCIESNESREKTLDKILNYAVNHSLNLVCLPAGYFTLKLEKEKDDFANRIIKKAKKVGVAIAFGIDITGNSTKGKAKEETLIPFFSAFWSPEYPSKIKICRQRSINSEDTVDLALINENRTLKVCGKTFGILSCGEIYNKEIVHHLVNTVKPLALIDLFHSAGNGFNRISTTIHDLGIPSYFNVHADTHSSPFCFGPRGEKKSMSKGFKEIPNISLYPWEI